MRNAILFVHDLCTKKVNLNEENGIFSYASLYIYIRTIKKGGTVMLLQKQLHWAAFPVLICLFQVLAAPDPNFHIYLLFGQSNMAGGCNHATVDAASIDRQDADCDTTPRVKVLAWGDCNVTSSPCPKLTLKRTYDNWYTAFPPLHKCTEGLGPADYFGKTLLDSIREDIKIGFIPCALSGQNIAVFEKGNKAAIDEHTQPYFGSKRLTCCAYEWMVKRCKIAQESGVIKGILMHHGEANKDESTYPGRVAKIVKDLRTDLNLGEEVPFLAGEVLRTGDAASHNTTIAKIPGVIPNSYVISSEGLQMRVNDSWRLHFSCASVRTFGKRYAEVFLKAASKDFVPRKGQVDTVNKRVDLHQAMKSTTDGAITVYTISGRIVRSYYATGTVNALRDISTGGVYIVSRKLDNGRTAVVPFIKE
ncbi:MAG: hypothetical protein JW913_03790 [Chitinispirillaceae bacterium]|nr:hypothetical protein [Chitinispirillaceae bacterium]